MHRLPVCEPGRDEVLRPARPPPAASSPRPRDIRAAILYDHFAPFVLVQLEEFGFCARGEAYIHGMNGVAEAVRHVRGTAVNRVPDVAHVLVTAGTGVPTSGLILGRG